MEQPGLGAKFVFFLLILYNVRVGDVYVHILRSVRLSVSL